VLRALKWVERVFYRYCAVVVGVTEGFRHCVISLGLPLERVVVVPNGVDWEMFVGAQPNRQLKQSQPFAGKFVVGYVGNIGLAQRLETMLEAADLLREEPVAFLVMGEGVEKTRLMELARQRGLDMVRFLWGAPRSEVPAVLATCDALLVMLRQDPLFEITIPSKIYECMVAGKPILCSVGGEAAALVAASKCGLTVPSSDGRALADSIRALMREPQLCRAFGEAGRAWAGAHFPLARLMGTYAKLLEGLAGHQVCVGVEPASADPDRI